MLLNGDYHGWLAASREFISGLSKADQFAIMGDNAIRFYRLPAREP
jgi:predicted TIM-barrel fold metal-dependent hydrolase